MTAITQQSRHARRIRTLALVALLAYCVVPRAALAQAQRQRTLSTESVCTLAAKFLELTANAVPLKNPEAARLLAELREISAARLLGCGSIGSNAAARVIRVTSTLTDPVALRAAVGPYRNLRDTAVFHAALDVAGDRAATVPARVFALRTLWVLRTGKYWISYERMLPSSDEASSDTIMGRCEDGLGMSDTRPYWTEGAALPAHFSDEIVSFATLLRRDASQPLNVRAAAGCVLLD